MPCYFLPLAEALDEASDRGVVYTVPTNLDNILSNCKNDPSDLITDTLNPITKSSSNLSSQLALKLQDTYVH